jgi:pyroglutamyl-peptidase
MRVDKKCVSRTSWFLIIVIVLLVFPCTTVVVSANRVVLVTGFEPFGVYPTNPSQVVAETLDGSSLDDADIIGLVLPVNFTTAVEHAIDAIEWYHPDVVISLGLDVKAKGIEVEKVGVNLKRFPLGDGRWSFPRFLERKSPFLRFTSLHTYTMVRKIRDADIAAKQSFFAGTYVCNALFYGLLGYVNDQGLNTSIGFIHVPLLDSQDPEGMSFDTMVDGVKIAIQESLVEY